MAVVMWWNKSTEHMSSTSIFIWKDFKLYLSWTASHNVCPHWHLTSNQVDLACHHLQETKVKLSSFRASPPPQHLWLHFLCTLLQSISLSGKLQPSKSLAPKPVSMREDKNLVSLLKLICQSTVVLKCMFLGFSSFSFLPGWLSVGLNWSSF